MRFKRIQLENFRPFVNEEIEFAVDSDDNITVIHGQNGSGKTTLLDAFRWALYGDGGSYEFPRLPNQGAMANANVGDSVTTTVEIDFAHDNSDYELERWATFEKQTATDFEGNRVDEGVNLVELDGHTRNTKNNPDTLLQQFLPERLSNLFLFDGEYIDRLSGVDDQHEIKTAIQNIMGLEVLERSIRHLEKVEGRFEDDVKEHGSAELEQLVSDQRDIKDQIDTLDNNIANKQQNRRELQADIDDIEHKLERIDGVEQLQQERTQLQARKEELEERIDAEADRLQNALSKQGYLPFAMGAVEATAKDIDELRQEGKIPSELDNKLIDDLLKKEYCICGRELVPNTDPYQEVAGYKNEDTPDGVDHASLRLISHIGTIQGAREEFFDTIEDAIAERSKLNDALTDVLEELDEVGKKIRDVDGYDPETDESPEELEETRTAKIEERATLKEQIKKHREDKSELEDERDELQSDIDEARDEKSEARLARKRMKAAQLVRSDLEESFEQLQQRVRSWSNDRVKDTFQEIATKSNYVAEIDEHFGLSIREGYDGTKVEVNKSRGERQIASLAFIGSLASIAQERYEADTDSSYFTGGIYPVVMDSPFGALDEEHRREISRIIPALADQVIVFVTDSQWKGPVEDEMATMAGREYKLQYDESGGPSGSPKTAVTLENPATAPGDTQ